MLGCVARFQVSVADSSADLQYIGNDEPGGDHVNTVEVVGKLNDKSLLNSGVIESDIILHLLSR
jgi:hypothetical protein